MQYDFWAFSPDLRSKSQRRENSADHMTIWRHSRDALKSSPLRSIPQMPFGALHELLLSVNPRASLCAAQLQELEGYEHYLLASEIVRLCELVLRVVGSASGS